jgi:hypothetical protein
MCSGPRLTRGTMTPGREAGDNTSAILLGILGTGSERMLRASGAAISVRHDTTGTTAFTLLCGSRSSCYGMSIMQFGPELFLANNTSRALHVQQTDQFEVLCGLHISSTHSGQVEIQKPGQAV